MSLPGKKILINDTNYHVYDQGDSDQVVLLLHGMPDTSSMWEHQATALVNKHVTLAVGHPGVMFGDMSMASVKENWYIYMNMQEHTAELYAQNNFKFMRETFIPSHPQLDEVTGRMADPAAMNASRTPATG